MTLGTRGDVQPFVALALALNEAGHEAVVCAPHRFAEFVTGQGVRFAGVDDGPMRQLDSAAQAGAVIQGGIRARIGQVRSMPAMFNQVLTDCWQVASSGAGAGTDVVVHNGQILAGPHVAEALGVPAVLGCRCRCSCRLGSIRGRDSRCRIGCRPGSIGPRSAG